MQPLRLCWDCKHFYFSEGHPGYSEYTPGSPASMECLKHQWDMDDFAVADDIRKAFQMARTCKLYDPMRSPIEELAMETEGIEREG